MALLQSAQLPVRAGITCPVVLGKRGAAPSVITIAAPAIAKTRVAGASLDNLALGGWSIATFALLTYYGVSLWRLSQQCATLADASIRTAIGDGRAGRGTGGVRLAAAARGVPALAARPRL